jgi:hypothetical protein
MILFLCLFIHLSYSFMSLICNRYVTLQLVYSQIHFLIYYIHTISITHNEQRERRERRVQFVAWNSVLASSLFVVLNCYMLLVLKLETEKKIVCSRKQQAL